MIADLAEQINQVRGVRFNNMKQVKESIKTVKSAAEGAAATLRAQFKQVVPDETLLGCVFTSTPGCRQLGFGSGLPVVHASGSFPAPVLILVYDAISGQVSVGSFLFFPEAG